MHLTTSPRLSRAFLFLGTLSLCLLAMTGCGKKSPEDQLQEAMQLLEQRQTPLAIIKLRDIISEYPDGDAAIEARFGLASVYTQLGREENMEDALELYQELYEMLGIRDGRGFEALGQSVQLKLRQEKFDDALALMDGAVEDSAADPEMQDALRTQRAALMLLFEDEETRAEGVAFLKATITSSEGTDNLRGQSREVLARHYRDEGDYEASNAVYDLYMDAFPEDPVLPMLHLAKAVNFRLADDEEARDAAIEEGARLMEEQLEEELNLNRRTQTLNDFAMMLSSAGALDKAEQAYRRIMADQPATRAAIDAQFGIAQMYLQHQRLDKAEEILQQIRDENPNTQIGEMATNGLEYISGLREQIAGMEAAGEEAPIEGADPADVLLGEQPAAVPEPGTTE